MSRLNKSLLANRSGRSAPYIRHVRDGTVWACDWKLSALSTHSQSHVVAMDRLDKIVLADVFGFDYARL